MSEAVAVAGGFRCPGIERRLRDAVLLAFTASAVLGMVFHSAFSDEIRAWLIVRDSPNLWDVVPNLRYDGHPILWYVFIWPISRMTASPDGMKVVCLVASVAAIWIFLRYGPWTRFEAILFPFGCYVLFEYTIKSRPYGIGMMLLMLFCALWPLRNKRIIILAWILGLMANVHVYFAVVAAALGAALLADRLERGGWRRLILNGRTDMTAAGITFLLLLAAVLVAAPPAHGDYSVQRASGIYFPVYILSDQIVGSFWLSSMEAFRPWQMFYLLGGTVLAVLLIGSILMAVRHSVPAVVFLAVSVGGLLAFFYEGFPAFSQHAGMILLSLVAGVWLGRCGQGSADGGMRLDMARTPLGVLLFAQAAMGILVVGTHLFVPYSNGYRVAAFIRSSGWGDDPVAGLGPPLTTVCGYLRKPWCFYAERSQRSSYLIMDGTPLMATDTGIATGGDPMALDRFAERSGTLGSRVTMLIPSYWPNDARTMARHGFRRVRDFDDSSWENFTVYRKGE